MNVIRMSGIVLGCCVLAALTSTVLAEDEKAVDKAKLIGTWEVTKSKDAPQGATVEFTKDGKMKVTYKQDGKEQKMEAKYSVDGNKITAIIKLPDGKEAKETATIEKLTDTELTIKDKKGDLDEYKKKK